MGLGIRAVLVGADVSAARSVALTPGRAPVDRLRPRVGIRG